MGIAGLPKKEANVLRGHEGAVLAARFNGDGNYCLSCGKDRTIRLWNPHRGIHIKTYKSHGREVRDVHVAPGLMLPQNRSLTLPFVMISSLICCPLEMAMRDWTQRCQNQEDPIQPQGI
ncbi:WD repeat domain-containing protein 83 [Vitis vinifera]|uniref:WD repeat domain-containing protein 83 n=1 Tax=Vitis vinifera TaxID=29760 RepID=A0A438K7L1_VITVI|nr:WD repeat domain-containing protein 83 [Vitis vinifera]RVX17191.1 WD repeat domain-containing protein 83 [Vitis vinifera]